MQAPIEVFEAVIDEASGNPASLRRLSLTCSAFLPRSRYHLFSCIVIRSVEQMESSCQLFDSRPWLPPLVRKVTLSVQVLEDNSVQNLRLLDVVPVYLLSNLPNLRSWTMNITEYKCFGSNQPWLSFHRSAFWLYHKYGGHIENLELIKIFMDNISEFTGLLSAFTGIHTLTCVDIAFRTQRYQDPTSLYTPGSATNVLNRPLKLDKLIAGSLLDTCTTEYLLVSSAVTLRHLDITIHSGYHENHPDNLARLEVAMSQLSYLLSLVLRIPAYGSRFPSPWVYTDSAPGIAYDMRLATKILQRLRDRLGDARVVLELEPVAALGCCLSSGNPSLEACEALEEELLTFPSCSIEVFDAKVVRRSGRTEFWSPAIRGAFSKLYKRGLFKFTHTQTNIPDPFGHEGPVTCVVASGDSKRIATASQDGTIIVWDAERGTPIQEWFAAVHFGPVYALALSPDGQRLISAGAVNGRGDPLVVWDVGDGVRKVASLELEGAAHYDRCACCTWSSDGALIAAASVRDGTTHVWDARTFQRRGKIDRSQPHPTGPLHQFEFSPNARYLAWICLTPPKCCISQSFTEESPVINLRHPHPDRQHIVASFSFDSDSRRIATAHRLGNDNSNSLEEGVVRIWDVATGAPLVLCAPVHPHSVCDVSFAPDGRSVLSAFIDGSVKIWHAESGKQKSSLKALHSAESSRAQLDKAFFSPDGKYIATASIGIMDFSGSGRDTVRVWRTSDASCVAEFTEHRSRMLHVAFSPNGELLTSADTDGMVHIRRLSRL